MNIKYASKRTRFNSRDITLIAISAALWAVFDRFLARVIWTATQSPIFCDTISLSMLMLAVWLVRKPGSATLVALIVFIIHMSWSPGFWFAAWIVAAMIVDAITRFVGYERCFSWRRKSLIMLTAIFAFGAAVAGLIIGTTMFGNNLLMIVLFALYHGVGGTLGSILGVILVKAVEKRGIISFTR